MAKNLVGSINLSKLKSALSVTKKGTPCIMIPIDQDGIFVSEKKGEVYLNVAVFVADEDDQYKNRASVTIGQSKEERLASKPKVYIGNLKQIWEGEANSQNQNTGAGSGQAKEKHIGPDDDLPF